MVSDDSIPSGSFGPCIEQGGIKTYKKTATAAQKTSALPRTDIQLKTYSTKYLNTPAYVERKLLAAGYTPLITEFTGINLRQSTENGLLLLEISPVRDAYPPAMGPNDPIGYRISIGFVGVPGQKRSELEAMLEEVETL